MEAFGGRPLRPEKWLHWDKTSQMGELFLPSHFPASHPDPQHALLLPEQPPPGLLSDLLGTRPIVQSLASLCRVKAWYCAPGASRMQGPLPIP